MISLEGTYNTNKQIRFKTSMLRSDLCDYSDAYILVKGKITVSANAGVNNNRDKKNRPLAFKNIAPFISCISKINDELIENAEDLDIVMPMYNLLEYSKNYRKTTGSLFNYYRDELIYETNDNNGLNENVINSEFFKYKTSITGNTYNVSLTFIGDGGNPIPNPNYDANKEGTKEAEIAVPLKYLSNFWRNLDMPLINCEISLTLSWYENCVITSLEKRTIGNTANRDDSPTNAVFKVTDCKLYVPVVTLSAEEDNELLNKLKTGFKRTIKWNICHKYLIKQQITI